MLFVTFGSQLNLMLFVTFNSQLGYCYLLPLLPSLCQLDSYVAHMSQFFFFQKNTPFISYKVLQMNYVQIPIGMRQFRLMWKPTDSRKGEDDHCQMKVIRCLLTQSDGSLGWRHFHSISLAVTLLDARIGWKRLVYTVASIESKQLLG